jgi:hypothetical protein
VEGTSPDSALSRAYVVYVKGAQEGAEEGAQEEGGAYDFKLTESQAWDKLLRMENPKAIIRPSRSEGKIKNYDRR